MGSRKDFLRQLAWGVSAGCFLPSVLASCEKEGSSLFGNQAYTGRVAVIGGGLAGLQAASILKAHGAQVTVYEANDRLGGRILSNAPFLGTNGDISEDSLLTSAPIELGADIVYSRNNAFFNLLHNYTKAIAKLPPQTEDLVNGKRVASNANSQSAERQVFNRLSGQFRSSNTPAATRLSELFIQLRDQAVDNLGGDTMAIIELQRNYANAYNMLSSRIMETYGVSPNELSVGEYRIRQQQYAYQNPYYRAESDALYSMVDSIFSPVIGAWFLNHPLTRLNHTGNQIELTFENGDTATFDKVVLTLPPPAYANVVFDPVLSEEKTRAISQIELSPCTKVFIKFRERFWGTQLGRLYATRPVSWITQHPTENILQAYAYGQAAETLANQGVVAVSDIIDVLNNAYGSQSDPVATRNLQDSRIYAWTSEQSVGGPFIPGAFSYISGDMLNARDVLATPLGKKLYFAGEATHTKGHASTLQGAIETGTRVAREILSGA